MAEKTISEFAGAVAERLSLEQEARIRVAGAASDMQQRAARYERYHKLYAPVDGDQWVEDRIQRPGKLHHTVNIVKAFVDVESRVLSILPRISLAPPSEDPAARARAEIVEKLNLRWLENSGWDMWMADWNRIKSIYGRGVLKPFWNEKDNRPDVLVVEQPQNLMLGWGSSDFTVIDWAVYRYTISPLQAHLLYPDIVVSPTKGDKALSAARIETDHTDPLDQKGTPGVMGSALGMLRATMASRSSARRYQESEYEGKQVEIWDYWYLNSEGTVCNAVLVQGVLSGEVREHPELPIIPYIVTESDHEPGSPEGMSIVELLKDIQLGLNRVLSHFAQLIADETDMAWQLVGENADTVRPGLVPSANEIVAPGTGNRIEPIAKNANQFPIQQLIAEYWASAHKVTGLPEIMFGNIPSADISGRAMAVQIEAAANRLDPKRRREYDGLIMLLLVWGFMVEKKNPTVSVAQPVEQEMAEGEAISVSDQMQPPELVAQEISLREVFEGMNHWRIIAPEITPRDMIERTQDIINRVNARLLSMESGMSQTGVEAPLEEQAKIESEQSNASLNPQAVQAQAAVLATMQSIQQNEMMMQQQQAEAQAVANAGTGEADAAAADAQARAPVVGEDQNQPMTQAGMAPPPGAGAPGGATGSLQTLVRNTPSGQQQAMSQISNKIPL